MVQVQIDCIRMSLMTQNRVVILKETDDERYLAIWIGPNEAEAITFELQSIRPRRPLTHDLLKSVIQEMGAEVRSIVVTELRRPDDIFYAKIMVELDGKQIEIDARPSDAIALAVRVNVPIFVEEDVMTAASVRPEEPIDLSGAAETAEAGDEEGENRLDIFKSFVDTLDIDQLDDE